MSPTLISTPDKNTRVDADTAQLVRTTSVTDPHTLLGWQVMLLSMDKKTTKGLYVVTAVQIRSTIKRGVFRLSCLEEQDQWMKLMHVDGIRGYPYVPLRKILEL
ncbi:hypothetical protein EON65_46495 [archaeon]|nr:MAG: hypothetical protein EON65_46495 [archaeon]